MFQLATVTFKTLHDLAPAYLSISSIYLSIIYLCVYISICVSYAAAKFQPSQKHTYSYQTLYFLLSLVFQKLFCLPGMFFYIATSSNFFLIKLFPIFHLDDTFCKWPFLITLQILGGHVLLICFHNTFNCHNYASEQNCLFLCLPNLNTNFKFKDQVTFLFVPPRPRLLCGKRQKAQLTSPFLKHLLLLVSLASVSQGCSFHLFGFCLFLSTSYLQSYPELCLQPLYILNVYNCLIDLIQYCGLKLLSTCCLHSNLYIWS